MERPGSTRKSARLLSKATATSGVSGERDLDEEPSTRKTANFRASKAVEDAGTSQKAAGSGSRKMETKKRSGTNAAGDTTEKHKRPVKKQDKSWPTAEILAFPSPPEIRYPPGLASSSLVQEQWDGYVNHFLPMRRQLALTEERTGQPEWCRFRHPVFKTEWLIGEDWMYKMFESWFKAGYGMPDRSTEEYPGMD